LEANVIEVVEDWFLLSYAFCWEGEKKITVRALPDFRGYQKNPKCDRQLVFELHKLMSGADAIVVHNGISYDFKKAGARFLYHGLPPVPPFKQIDTLRILRKHFRLDSNRLDSAAQFLGLGRKLAHEGKNTWLGCMRGDPKAWKIMRKYNAHDVKLLQALYNRVKPWAASSALPNVNLFTGNAYGCPFCRSSNIKKRGLAYTRTTTHQRYRCDHCRAWHAGERLKPGRAPQEREINSAKTIRRTSRHQNRVF
jgi:hypothetical protein